MRLPLAAALPLAWILACTPPADGWRPTGAPEPGSLYAPHGSVGAFFTPWEAPPRSFARGLRWWLSRNAYADVEDPPVPVRSNDGRDLSGSAPVPTVTWVGHSTFAVHDGDDVFLTDPHFGPRALIPARRVPPGVPLAAIPPDAFALVSHNHYDHLDAHSVEALPDSVTWFVPLGMAQWFRDRQRQRVVELDWWESARHGRFTLTCLPSQHWSARIEQGENTTLWCTWLVDSGERRYFFAGDTGYFHGFEEFGRRFGPIDVAMLPIGAYEPRWFMRGQHMNPSEALRATRELDAGLMLAMHWGTFDLTDEPPGHPPRALAEAVAEQRFDAERVRVFAVGERMVLPAPRAQPQR